MPPLGPRIRSGQTGWGKRGCGAIRIGIGIRQRFHFPFPFPASSPTRGAIKPGRRSQALSFRFCSSVESIAAVESTDS